MTKTLYVTGCKDCPFRDTEFDGCVADDAVGIETLVAAREKRIPPGCPLHGGGVDVRIASWGSSQIAHDVETPAVTVRDALLLVGIDIPLDRIEWRNLVARKEALAWATNAHLRAADNKLPELPCPEWVRHWRAR